MAARNQSYRGCLSIIFPWLAKGGDKSKDYTVRFDSGSDEKDSKFDLDSLPYRLRDDFLSPAEFSFYKVLSGLVGTHLVIQSKVRLADIFFVSRPNENMSYFHRIAQRHVDFLICEPQTMKPLLGIELDDSSHNRSDRQERDDFVDHVFEAAELPLVRVPAEREYNSREIAAQIAPIIKDKFTVTPPTSATVTPLVPVQIPVPASASTVTPSVLPHTASLVPLCPKCGIPMVLRTVSQGQYKGRQFYGCRNYPHCREMKPVPESKM
jgi:hypothetical protein